MSTPADTPPPREAVPAASTPPTSRALPSSSGSLLNPARESEQHASRFPVNYLELVDDPIARAILAAIDALEPGLQFAVFAKLQLKLAHDELAGGPQDTRVMNVVRSLNEAYAVLVNERVEAGGDLTDRVQLSEPEYVRLRSTRRDHCWAAPPTIRRVVSGGWNDGLRRAHLPTVDEADAVWVERGQFSWEEVRDCILDCIAAMREHLPPGAPDPDPGLRQVLSWAKRPDVAAGPKRRVRSVGPFNRYGGFLVVKHAALTDGKQPQPEGAPRAPRSQPLRSRSAYQLTDEEYRAAIHRVRDRIGRVPRMTDFIRVREEILDEEAASGNDKLKAFPSYSAIHSRYGCWDAALEDAGLPPFKPVAVDPATGRATHSGPAYELTDQQVIDGLREARKFLEPFNSKTYTNYRRNQGPYTPSGVRIASYGVIRQRFGWPKAVERAFGGQSK